MMNRFIASLVLICSVITLPLVTEPDSFMWIGGVRVGVADTALVPVWFSPESQADSVVAMLFEVEYDTTQLAFLGAEFKSSPAVVVAVSRKRGQIRVAMAAGDAFLYVGESRNLVDLKMVSARPGELVESEVRPLFVQFGEGGQINDPGDAGLVRMDPSLPVELLSFQGVLDENRAVLSWATASEVMASSFRITRRGDNEAGYTFVGELPAAGAPSFYQLVDTLYFPGGYTYKLSQMDQDGTVATVGSTYIGYSQDDPVRLDGPFPNPSTGMSRLAFSLSTSEWVKVVIYDVIGREVRVAWDNYLPAQSRQELRLDLHGLPAGLYLVQLTSGSFSVTRSMVLIQ